MGSFADADGGLNGCGVLDTSFLAMVDLAWRSMDSMSPMTVMPRSIRSCLSILTIFVSFILLSMNIVARVPISSFCFYILQFDISTEEELGLIGIFYGQYMSEIADWLRSNNTLYNKCKQTFCVYKQV